ncbi:MAG: nucleoside phosphorylase [Alphaproteobacteria bacterium]|nr:nucleoside phosphorylase [Alphaproteobacteria bacterium]
MKPPQSSCVARVPPIAETRDWQAPSVFRPESLLREARRQKGLHAALVPPVCVLDPDGDLVRYVEAERGAVPAPHWACYHTRLIEWGKDGQRIGAIGNAVGAAYAVLVAEQLFCCGCRLLISVTSAGQLVEAGSPPYYVAIDRALRDEGTSYHYLPPSDFSFVNHTLLDALWPALSRATTNPIHRGASWTTDAPFRETEVEIAAAAARGLLVVEMEAAGLYAFAAARGRDVLCLAHVSNRLGQAGDFEKGDADGAPASLRLVEAAAAAWREQTAG